MSCFKIFPVIILFINITASSFIIDDDWVLGFAYPFPIGICLQISPEFFYFSKQWSYYECSSDKQTVTKYQWDTDTFNDNCNLTIPATSTTIYTKNITNITSLCSIGYFECDDKPNNYLTLDVTVGTDEQHFDDIGTLLNPGYIVTNQCFCTENGTAASFSCTETEAITTNYTNITMCMANIDGDSNVFGDTETATFMTQETVDIYGIMRKCVVNGNNIVPTSNATMETTHGNRIDLDDILPRKPNINEFDNTNDLTIMPSVAPTEHAMASKTMVRFGFMMILIAVLLI